MSRSSPYQGIVPYSEADADWFFGRDSWREIVVDNLKAYRLSILYGPSGVGKSSLLNAGVVRGLREQARRNLAQHGAAELAIVPFASWNMDDPVDALTEAVRASVEQIAPELSRNPPSGSLADLLAAWGERIRGPVLIVLDQFEEYFLYRGADGGSGSFHEQFSLALRRRDAPANFVVSIREDALAQLDSFEGHVPGLLDNLLRLEHLDRQAAREAIELPPGQWNRLEAGANAEVAIEPALTEAVLSEVAAGKVVVGDAGRAVVDTEESEDRIEAPYLQLVLTRLWDAEQRSGSQVLRAETLVRLGGAERIVRTHLDATMDAFPRREQDVAARAFRYLVTPSGRKIAHRAPDLADYADVPGDRLEPVLAQLGGEARILRPVGNGAFEIYHDALAGPVLDWSARQQERWRHRRERLRTGLFASAALVFALVAAAFVVLALRAQHAEEVARSRELTAKANLQLDDHPQESLSLAVRAVDAVSTEEAQAALRSALAAARVRTVMREHDNPILSAAFSPDSELVVTGSDDNTARVWRVENGQVDTVLRHDESVPGAAFSPDGELVVTASDDGTGRLWDAGSGKALAVLRGHDGSVFSAVFSPDGDLIVTASDDGTARLWDAGSGKALAVLRGHEGSVFGAAFSPDGELVVTAGEDGTARIWEAATERSLIVLRGHEDPVRGAAFSPDGELVATAGEDGTARIWEAAGGVSRAVLHGHTGGVLSVAFSPLEGELVVTAGEDATVRIWETETGHSVVVLRGHARTVNSASFSPDGMLVATASFDRTARIWEARERLVFLRGHGAGVLGATFSPDGRLVVTAGGDRTARIWDASSGKGLAVLRGHEARVVDADFNPDGRRVVTASADRTARVWDANSGKGLAVLRGHDAGVGRAAFNPDGRLIVTASVDRTARVWEASSGKSLAVLRGHDGPVLGSAFSPDGRLVGTASLDGTARIWETGSWKSVAVLRAHDGPVFHASFSPDARLVITAGYDHTARVWEARGGKGLAVLRGHESRVLDADFSPDGELVVTTGGDQTARVWEAKSGKGLAVLRGHDARVLDAAFGPDGKLVVTASRDGTARIWEARTGQNLVVLRGFTGPVYGAAFSSDGRLVAAATRDETAWIWRCRVCGPVKELLASAREQIARGQPRELTHNARG